MSGRFAAALAAIVVAALTAAPAGASLPAKATERVETKVRSKAPDRRQVTETFVRLHAPLPASTGQHPARCDWIGYLRFRNADGPRRSPKADAVIALIPGFLGGAANFDQLARNTVRSAARRGKNIEVWALDRRSNCLEDHTGVHAAARAGDATLAWDYYWDGRELRGRTFDGFVGQNAAAWLNDVGLEQTLNDWFTVIREGLPRRRDRARKLVCGGHSMGGPLTALFASWDFDGDPSTKGDAGYRQCAGLVGLDTRLRYSVAEDGSGLPVSLDPAGILLLATIATGSPYVNTPPITPETIQVPSVFGVGTFLDPGGTDLLRELPRTIGVDLAQRFLFSRDAVHFATQVPSIRDFTTTNEVTLAGVFDDNSAPLFFLRTSLGFLAGGPVTEKNFPSPDDTQALPEDPETPLYYWQDYRQVGRDAPVPLNSSGNPFTYRNSEVTDIRQFARIQFEAPANFIEQYFPTRLLRDLDDAGGGDRSGALAKIRYEGVAKRPALLINAADSDANTPDVDGPPFLGDNPPNGRSDSKTILIPGYNHLDVATAARRQNDGRPEPSSRELWRFARLVTR